MLLPAFDASLLLRMLIVFWLLLALLLFAMLKLLTLSLLLLLLLLLLLRLLKEAKKDSPGSFLLCFAHACMPCIVFISSPLGTACCRAGNKISRLPYPPEHSSSRTYLLALLTMFAPTAMADRTKLTKVKPESDPDSGQFRAPSSWPISWETCGWGTRN